MPKARPGSPIQVQARPMCNVQWLCPACGYIMGSMRIPWKRGRISCIRCGRDYRMGLGFSSTPSLPPHNAIYKGPWQGGAVNVLGPSEGLYATGRITGRIDWECPICRTVQSAAPGWDSGDLPCTACVAVFYIYLILYNSPRHARVACPPDWVPFQTGQLNVQASKTARGYPPPAAPID